MALTEECHVSEVTKILDEVSVPASLNRPNK